MENIFNSYSQNSRFLGCTTAEFEILYDMKERVCRCNAAGAAPESASASPASFTASTSQTTSAKSTSTSTPSSDSKNSDKVGKFLLPDGTPLYLPSTTLTAPAEILFHPSMIGSESSPVQSLLQSSLNSCDLSLRSSLNENIVLSGGTTLLPGFPERLLEEVRAVAPEYTRVRILAPEGREGSEWSGGSILASLSTFRDLWISKQEWEEEGDRIIRRRAL